MVFVSKAVDRMSANDPEDETEVGDDRTRIGIRITAGFAVKVLTCAASIYQGEPLTGLIALAIVYANNAHLDRHMHQPPRYVAVATPPPEAERRPISVIALARLLDLPVETVRRHVKRLIEKGFFRRVKGGIVTTQMPISDEHDADLQEIYVLLRRFSRQIEWAGVRPKED